MFPAMLMHYHSEHPRSFETSRVGLLYVTKHGVTEDQRSTSCPGKSFWLQP
nr:hypothetical protein Q903MT_gene4748 [Picea sitchensis]